jgi:hypothetical protein
MPYVDIAHIADILADWQSIGPINLINSFSNK